MSTNTPTEKRARQNEEVSVMDPLHERVAALERAVARLSLQPPTQAQLALFALQLWLTANSSGDNPGLDIAADQTNGTSKVQGLPQGADFTAAMAKLSPMVTDPAPDKPSAMINGFNNLVDTIETEKYNFTLPVTLRNGSANDGSVVQASINNGVALIVVRALFMQLASGAVTGQITPYPHNAPCTRDQMFSIIPN